MNNPKKTEAGLISLEALASTSDDYQEFNETINDQIKKAQIPVGKVEDNLSLHTPEEDETEEEVDETIILNTETTEETEENVEVVESEDSKRFKALLKKTFGDLGVIEQEVDGEVVEFNLDDIEMDEETFESIISQKIEQEREQAQAGKISVEGISDITKAMIEVDQKGGDLANLLNVKQNFYDPISSIDMSTDEGKMQMVALRLSAKGLSQEDISIQLEGIKAKGVLDESADRAEEELKTLINQALDNEKAKAAEQAKAVEEERKAYKSNLKQSLSSFELKDSVKNKIVDLATKVDNKGRYEIDNLYGSAMQDPEKAAKLTLFLLDEKEFIEQVTSKKVIQEKLSTLGRLRLIPKKGSQQLEKNNKHQEKGLIPLENLSNQ